MAKISIQKMAMVVFLKVLAKIIKCLMAIYIFIGGSKF